LYPHPWKLILRQYLKVRKAMLPEAFANDRYLLSPVPQLTLAPIQCV